MPSEPVASDSITNKAAKNNEMSIGQVIVEVGKWYRLVLSKWKQLLLFTLLGCCLGLTYAFIKKTIYIADCTFVLDEGEHAGGGLGQYAGLASMVGIDIGGGGGGLFQGDNIIQLYKSKTMITKTLLSRVSVGNKSELLIDRYINFTGLRKSWSGDATLEHIDFNNINGNAHSRLQDSVISTIVDEIDKKWLIVSKPDKKLSIINVQVRSTDEFFSKEFNDRIVKNVNDFYIQTKTKKAIKNVAILQHKTDSVKAALNGNINAGASSLDAIPNLNPNRQLLRTPVQKSQVNAEANRAILTELVKNLELSKISLSKETPLIQVIDNPVLPLEKEKVSKVKAIITGGLLMMLFCISIISIKLIIKQSGQLNHLQ